MLSHFSFFSNIPTHINLSPSQTDIDHGLEVTELMLVETETDCSHYLLGCYVAWSVCVFTCVFIQFSQFSPSCVQLCDSMNCSTPGLPVHPQLPELLKLMSIESVMPPNHLILCQPFSSCLQSFPASGSFPMSQIFTPGGQSTGVSASASVLPGLNIQA